MQSRFNISRIRNIDIHEGEPDRPLNRKVKRFSLGSVGRNTRPCKVSLEFLTGMSEIVREGNKIRSLSHEFE